MIEKPYMFRLRKDMPPGFIKNSNHPELPAMRNFLEQYHEQRFGSPEEFGAVLQGYPGYREANHIRSDPDDWTHRGLYLSGPHKGTYRVMCSNNSHSGYCEFGKLEKKVLK